tara:strand:+ start:3334 stop:3774 length:441 start_codon:yes stop_codon:yes gene_type:complete
MKNKLQEKLFSKYPKIFRQKDLPMTQTCMCFGIDCGDGWYWLLDMLCGCIQSYIDNNSEVHQVEASQVKQKFGGLRFYTEGGDENTCGTIELAEHMSYHICERCGSTECIPPQKTTKGWISTICNKCIKEKKVSLKNEKTPRKLSE